MTSVAVASSSDRASSHPSALIWSCRASNTDGHVESHERNHRAETLASARRGMSHHHAFYLEPQYIEPRSKQARSHEASSHSYINGTAGNSAAGKSQ